MVEGGASPVKPSSPKAAKRKAARKHAKKAGPTVGELIVKAVSASKERGGMSLAALKKALAAGGYDVDKNKARVRVAVKTLVKNGSLLHTKGTGASGSFKINKAGAKKKKPGKKAAGKKAAGAKKRKKAKKPAAKKSPKKAKRRSGAKKAKKSAKKPKRPAAKKTPKSPRKARAARPKVAKPKSRKAKKAAH
ncbi:histone H1-like [Megalops cyprinoides]|uniref:histone H1-like n=1 Tax=Megalops cyprinoides TaxID=118141 RepID=UPI001864B199|nr:histone H1-like [Megalops cyprinoides]